MDGNDEGYLDNEGDEDSFTLALRSSNPEIRLVRRNASRTNLLNSSLFILFVLLLRPCYEDAVVLSLCMGAVPFAPIIVATWSDGTSTANAKGGMPLEQSPRSFGGKQSPPHFL